MKQYLDLLRQIKTTGVVKTDRTGTGTKSIFGPQMRFDLRQGFPLLTTKKVHLKSIIYELLWFLKGDTNTKYLKDNGVTIWNEWEDANGDLGPVYGKQWRSWQGADGKTYDQIQAVIDTLKKSPDSRRIIVNAWNVAELADMALTPCHCLFQFYTAPLTYAERVNLLHETGTRFQPTPREDGFEMLTDSQAAEYMTECDRVGIPAFRLDCQLYQRSADFFIGVPFNIASYALLTMMVAQCVNMVAGEFIWTGGDTHLYLNHMEQADTQLAREPRTLPQMVINPDIHYISEFHFTDFDLQGYNPQPGIKAPIAV